MNDHHFCHFPYCQLLTYKTITTAICCSVLLILILLTCCKTCLFEVQQFHNPTGHINTRPVCYAYSTLLQFFTWCDQFIFQTILVISDASATHSCCTERSVSAHSAVSYTVCAVYIGLFMLQCELYRIQFEAKMYQGVSETRLFMFVIVVPCTVSLYTVYCWHLH
jgi:hypothetical protein